MSSERPPVSRRVKMFLWVLYIAVVFVFSLVAATLIFEPDEETTQPLAPAPTLISAPRPTPAPKPTSTPRPTPSSPSEQYQRELRLAAATKYAGESTPTPASRSLRSSSTSHSVWSDQNVVGRKQISLSSGRYTLSATFGCVNAELARLPSDDLVFSAVRGPRSGHVASGSYILRAIGNGCKATLGK